MLYCFPLSFPYLHVIPVSSLCHSRLSACTAQAGEGGNLSFFSVSVGVEFIRPVLIAGSMNQAPAVLLFCRGTMPACACPHADRNCALPYIFCYFLMGTMHRAPTNYSLLITYYYILLIIFSGNLSWF